MRDQAADHAPRRAPTPGDRLRDADRTRRNLLTAALDIFSSQGYAGARVQDIAERAGVNKQLISYYFGGKEGLYRALQEEWRQRESGFAGPAATLDELAVTYLADARKDPRMMRLLLWAGLATEVGDLPEETRGSRDLSGLRARQERGEIAPELDPGCVMLFLMAGLAAPVALPQMVWQVLGEDPRSPQFQDRYAEQVRRIVRRLGLDRGDDDRPATSAGFE